jgi:transcriptional regulator with XRE-family HTH domain
VGDSQARTLAEKLNHLFQTVYPAGRGPWKDAEVAAGLTERGENISDVYIWKLRTGRATNPTIKHLQALAGWFQVNVGYFVDDTATAAVEAQLAVLAELRDRQDRDRRLGQDGGAAYRALRHLDQMSPPSRKAVLEIINQIYELDRRAAGDTGRSLHAENNEPA